MYQAVSIRRSSALLLTVLLPCALTQAADIVWTNLAGGNWATAANWDPNQVPGSADTAWITNNGTYTVTLNASATNANLMLGGASGTQTFNHSANTLTLNGGGIGSFNAIYNLGGGTLTGSGSLTLAGSFNWTAGTFGNFGSGFVLAANGGLAISGPGSKTCNGGALVNGGAGTWSNSQVFFNNNAMFSNAPSGTLDFQTDGNAFSPGSSSLQLVNAGLLRKTAGSGTTTVTLPCRNTGSVEVDSGILALTVADSTGAFSINPGATLSLSGTANLSPTASIEGAGNLIVTSGVLTNSGTFHVDGTNTFSGGTIALSGSCTITNGPVTISGGTVVLNGTGTVTPASFTFSSGSLLGNMAVTVAGLSSWTGGSFGSAGSTLALTMNGGLAMSGAVGRSFNGGRILNNGLATWTAGQTFFRNNALLTNAPGATLDFQADGTAFVLATSGPQMFNGGTLRKSAGSGTTTLDVACSNYGLVEVNSGTLALNLVDSTGAFTMTAGNTLSLSGTGSLSPSVSIVGAGNLTVTSGTLTNNGALRVDGTNAFSGGSITFNGNCVLTNGPLVVSGGTVTLSGTGTLTPGSLTLSSGNLRGNMPVSVSGSMTWTGGTLGSAGSGLVLTANGGLTLSGTGGRTFTGGTLVNSGVALWSAGQTLLFNNALLSNAPSATLDFQADGSAVVLGSSGQMANAGTLRKTGGSGTTTIGVPCSNSGTVQVNTGTLALTVSDSSGVFNMVSGSTLSLNGTANLSAAASIEGAGNFTATSGTITNNGIFHVDGTSTFSGGTMSLNGSCSITNAPIMLSGGTAAFNGTVSVIPSSLTLSSGSLLGSMAITVAGPTVWTGSTLGSAGSSLVVTANGGLTISAGGNKNFTGARLINTALATWTGSQVSFNNNAIFSNAPSATLDFQADGNAFIASIAGSQIFNAGLLRKSAGSGTTTVTVPCANLGIVEVDSGTLALTLGDSSGLFTAFGGSTLSVNGTANLSATASIEGPGNFNLTSGIITNNGAFRMQGTNTFAGGTVAFNGACVLTNGPLVVNGGTVVFSGSGNLAPGTLNLSSGNLLGSMALTIPGLTSWTFATAGSAGSTLSIIANGGLALSGGSRNFSGGTVVNNGLATWSAGQTSFRNNAVFSNAPMAVLDLQIDGNSFINISGSPQFLNTGTLRKSAGAGSTTFSIPCNNFGNVEVNSGTLALSIADSSGSFTMGAGNTLSLNGTGNLSPAASIDGAGNLIFTSGTVTNYGFCRVQGSNTFSGGLASFNGNCFFTNGPLVVNGGIAVFNASGVVAASSMNLASGTLFGNMAMTATGPVLWSGTAVGSAGSTLRVTANGGLTINGVGRSFNGGTIVNNSTATWSSALVFFNNNATLSNGPAGTFDFLTDGSAFNLGGSTAQLFNAGTLRKTAGVGATTIFVPCNNSGTVQANTGSLNFSSDFVQNSGQTILNGGTYTFTKTAQLRGGSLSGSGTITGSVSNNATVSPGASAGLLAISGTYSEGPNAHLVIELGGTAPGTGHDQLSIGDKATLAGSLDVSFINGFLPAPNNVFTVLVCNARSGAFSAINSPTNNLGTIYTAKSVLLETGNASPVAQLSINSDQVACHTYLVSASGTDPDGTVTNIALMLDTNILAAAPGPSVRTTFSYDFPGDITLTALATDNKGASGATNVIIHVSTLPLLVLDAAGFATNRAFKLCMVGETGTNYQILGRDNLATSNWLVLGIMESTNGIWRFSDSGASNTAHRFYRANRLP